MPPLVLTPEKAFRAIQEMNRRGKRLSGRAVWQQCGEIGSITTAVKWVKVAKSITQSDEPVDQDLVELWETIAQGKDIPASPPVVHELPQGLRELFDRFSQQVAIALQQSVAEETRQTQQTAASEIEQAEAETIKTQGQCQNLIQELQQQEAIAQQQDQTIAGLREEVASLRARREELERQLNQVEQQKEGLEEEVRTRSQQVGTLSEKLKHFEQDIQELQTTLSATQANEQIHADQCRNLKRDNAVLEARASALQSQLEQERQERRAVEAQVVELRNALTQQANDAGAAREKAAQYERHIKELKDHLNRQQPGK